MQQTRIRVEFMRLAAHLNHRDDALHVESAAVFHTARRLRRGEALQVPHRAPGAVNEDGH